MFGIADQRTDKRIDFVGGGRGLDELERRVDSGEMAVAFALYPTQMDDLMAVADAGAHHAAEIDLVRAQARRRHGQPRAGLTWIAFGGRRWVADVPRAGIAGRTEAPWVTAWRAAA